MLTPGRKFSSGTGYRYGFNGKELDKDITSNNYDFGVRVYDGRIGRWLSTDIITKAFISPYNFAANNPANYLDPDGQDIIHFYEIHTATFIDGKSYFQKTYKFSVVEKNNEPNVFIHHKLDLTYDGLGGEGKVSKPVNTRFYPDIPGKSSGLTTSYGFLKIKDDDRKTLIKFIDEYGLSQKDVGEDYKEFSQQGQGLSQKAKNAQWWGDVFAEKKFQEQQASEEKTKANFVLGAAMILAPEFFISEVGTGGEIFYRTMSEAAIFEATGSIPAGAETMISPTLSYAKSFKGVTFQINAKAGTFENLLKMGVSDGSELTEPLGLPSVQKGWKSRNAFFKAESNSEKDLAPQINIGLGNGNALKTFNKSIISFKRL